VRLSETPLYHAVEISAAVEKLAAAIRGTYQDTPFTVVVVLKGAAWFGADLVRHLPPSTTVEFMRAKSYVGDRSAGPPTFPLFPESGLEGQHVLIVEDILDTGRTLAAARERIEGVGPASLRSCVLLDKPIRREVAVEADFHGFQIEDDHFVVGYGLDYNEQYRALPAIYRLLPE